MVTIAILNKQQVEMQRIETFLVTIRYIQVVVYLNSMLLSGLAKLTRNCENHEKAQFLAGHTVTD